MLTAEPKAYGSNWYASRRVEDPQRGRLTVECDVDVCIIGAGLAGLTTALELSQRGWSVVVLEAQSVGWSASGRNTGVVLPGFAASPDSVIERIGLEAAKALWTQSVAGAEYVRNAARTMPGVELSENGWLHVSTTDRTRALAHEAARISGDFGIEVEPWPMEQVRSVLASPRYFHGLHYPQAFTLHPLNYALGLAAACEANGVRIFEDTPVRQIDPAGVRKRIVTAHARVRASHVVLAGSVHIAPLLPQFGSTLQPLYVAAITTTLLDANARQSVLYPGAISDTDTPGHHHHIVDGRLTWSGATSGWLGAPKRQGAELLRQVRRTYPALKGTKAEYAWIGAIGQTVHGMPQIGEVSPGVWLLSGFGGHGINTTAMAGTIVARAIAENDATWTMFKPFELVWAGAGAGRAARALQGWSHEVRVGFAGFMARWRDRRRRQAAAADKAESATPAMPYVPHRPDDPLLEPALATAHVAPVPPPDIAPALSEPVAPEPILDVAPAAPEPAAAETAPMPVVEVVAETLDQPAPAVLDATSEATIEPEPIVETIDEPVTATVEPVAVAIVEAEIPEGQSGGAAPPNPEPVPEPAAPEPAVLTMASNAPSEQAAPEPIATEPADKPKRKRGKKRKTSSSTTTTTATTKTAKRPKRKS